MYKAQCTEAIFKLLDDNNILYVLVPANITNKLPTLDLRVNKPAKDFLRRKFQVWYSNIILKQLEDGTTEDVDMRMSVMKPLTAQWVIEMYHYFTTHPDIIINGFVEAEILYVLQRPFNYFFHYKELCTLTIIHLMVVKQTMSLILIQNK